MLFIISMTHITIMMTFEKDKSIFLIIHIEMLLITFRK